MLNDVVSDVSYAGSALRGEILGVERRRFRHDDDKLEIVMSVGIGGATVTQVAHRHEIIRQQIYAWRHELKKKGLWSSEVGALFFSVDIPVATGVAARELSGAVTQPPAVVELHLRGDCNLHFGSTMDPVALTALIRAVEAA